VVLPLDVWLQSRVAGRKASQIDLRLGSEYLVLTHHLAQEFGTGDVHRSFAILSLRQAGKLFQLFLDVRFEVPFLTKFHERVMKPWILLQLFQGTHHSLLVEGTSNKAANLHYLLEDTTPEDLPYPKDAMFIQDGMALLHTFTNLPPTWGEICLHVLGQMVATKHFLFSTDSYHPYSIKAQERLRPGSSEKIILAGPATRKPYDFKMFLAHDDNKKQLCQLLPRVWSGRQAASGLETTEMAVLIVEGKAHQLVSSKGEVS